MNLNQWLVIGLAVLIHCFIAYKTYKIEERKTFVWAFPAYMLFSIILGLLLGHAIKLLGT